MKIKQVNNDRYCNSRMAYGAIAILTLFSALLNIDMDDVFSLAYEWPVNELTINYTYGFVRRGFLGSITYGLSHAFSMPYHSAISIVMIIEEIAFITLVICFAIVLLRKSGNNKAICYICILFFSANAFAFYFADWGEPDIVLISLTIVMLLLIIKKRALCLVPCITAVCLLIHEGYPMMYFAIVLSALLNISVVEENKRKRTYYRVILVATGAIASALFVYFYFFSNNNVKIPFEQMIANTKALIGDRTETNNLEFIYYNGNEPNLVMWRNGRPTENFYLLISFVAANVLLCIPMIVQVISLWKKVVKNANTKSRKIMYFMCAASGLLTLPLVFMHTDEGRWFYDFVFFEFLTIGTFVLLDDDIVRKSLDETVKPTIVNMIVMVLYYLAYSVPNKMTISEVCYAMINLLP